MDKFEVTDCARSLRSLEAVALRKAMLREPHIVPLANSAKRIENESLA